MDCFILLSNVVFLRDCYLSEFRNFSPKVLSCSRFLLSLLSYLASFFSLNKCCIAITIILYLLPHRPITLPPIQLLDQHLKQIDKIVKSGMSILDNSKLHLLKGSVAQENLLLKKTFAGSTDWYEDKIETRNNLLKNPNKHLNVSSAQIKRYSSTTQNNYLTRKYQEFYGKYIFCYATPHNINHLFGWSLKPTDLTTNDLWFIPTSIVRFLGLETRIF